MFNHEPENYRCPLCRICEGAESKFTRRSDIVYETDDAIAYVAPRWWVNNPGNVMIAPRAHFENIYNIPDDLLFATQRIGKIMAIGMKEAYGCDGVSLRQHNEPAGDQDVWHFHLHVFPRWSGDALYLNHENRRFVPAEERAPYAQELREYFQGLSPGN